MPRAARERSNTGIYHIEVEEPLSNSIKRISGSYDK